MDATCDRIVHLNVGGKRIDTRLSTLLQLDYFRSAYNLHGDQLGASPDKPFFMDRNGKWFRRLLDFLLDPRTVGSLLDVQADGSHSLDRLKTELDFWGLELEPSRRDELEFKKSCSRYGPNSGLPPSSTGHTEELLEMDLRHPPCLSNGGDAETPDAALKSDCMCTHLHHHPSHTFLRSQFNRTLPSCRFTQGVSMKRAPFVDRVHNPSLDQGAVVSCFFAIVPKSCRDRFDALLGIKVTISLGTTQLFQGNLGMCTLLDSQASIDRPKLGGAPRYNGNGSRTFGGNLYIPIPATWNSCGDQVFLRTGSSSCPLDFKVELETPPTMTGLPRLPDDFELGFRWTQTGMDLSERDRFRDASYQQLRLRWAAHAVVDSKATLRGGFVRSLLWKTNEVCELATLTAKHTNTTSSSVSSVIENATAEQHAEATSAHFSDVRVGEARPPVVYTLNRGDFQFYEREKVGFQPLPKSWGTMNFGTRPHDTTPDSGGFCCELPLTISFHPRVTGGTVWIALVEMQDGHRFQPPSP